MLLYQSVLMSSSIRKLQLCVIASSFESAPAADCRLLDISNIFNI